MNELKDRLSEHRTRLLRPVDGPICLVVDGEWDGLTSPSRVEGPGSNGRFLVNAFPHLCGIELCHVSLLNHLNGLRGDYSLVVVNGCITETTGDRRISFFRPSAACFYHYTFRTTHTTADF